MIAFNNVTKYYPTRFGPRYVFKSLSFALPDDRDIAILGLNGAGKSTLLRLIGGIDFPSSGKVKANRFISWPLALSSGLQSTMTGRENVRFVCRIHGLSRSKSIEDYVQDFSELGQMFDLPLVNYSSGMRSKYSFAVSMAIDFDTYLIDEIMSVGDASFAKKCKEALQSKRETSNIVMVSHNVSTIRDHCNAVLVLSHGNAEFYESIERGIYRYENL